MNGDGENLDRAPGSAMPAEVPLVPAGAIGFLLYGWALQLILANPPANDLGASPRPG